MSQPENNNLRFSIDETVWLKEGQEADEILSLALEPDITIEENRSHITIKGGLKLTGEYRPVDHYDVMDEEPSPIQDHLSFRTIDEISLSEEGIATLEHIFPVDITIPSNRINDLEDVYVMVESFDYDIPEKGCIQLFADITISGLIDQQPEVTYDYEEEVEDISYESAYPFQREENDDENIKPFQIVEATSYREKDHFEDEETEPPEVGLSIRKDEEDMSENNNQNENENIESLPQLSSFDEVEKENEKTNENVKEKKQKPNHQDENALYLTKMLSNEDDQLAKIRLCIVQQGDSLDKISERYRVPVTTLLRTNRLDSDSVDEGQVLNIPVAVHKK